MCVVFKSAELWLEGDPEASQAVGLQQRSPRGVGLGEKERLIVMDKA